MAIIRAIEYWNFIKASMPNWVLPPGDSPFVAAFPVPEVYVVPDPDTGKTWTVERVTTITTSEGEMAQKTHSYETAVTRGQSTSIANTVTWNEWEEVSEAVERPMSSKRDATSNKIDKAQADSKQTFAEMRQTLGLGMIGNGSSCLAAGCILITGGVCAVVGGAALGLAAAGILRI